LKLTQGPRFSAATDLKGEASTPSGATSKDANREPKEHYEGWTTQENTVDSDGDGSSDDDVGTAEYWVD